MWKKHSALLVIREMQVKTTMSYHFTSIRMAKIKDNYKCWQGCGEIGTLIHCWCECKMVQPLCKTVQQSFKKLNIELLYDPEIILLGRTRQLKTYVHTKTWMWTYITALFMIVKKRKQPKCLRNFEKGGISFQRNNIQPWKKNEVQIYTTTGINPESIMLSKRSQKQKADSIHMKCPA